MTNFTLKLTFNGENRFGVSRIRGMCQTRGLVVAFLEMLILRNKKEERMRGGEMGLEPIALQSMLFLQKKELPFKLELIGKFDF